MNDILPTSWAEYPTSIHVHSADDKLDVYEIGSVVTFEGRWDQGVIITYFFGDEKGPHGFEYLPWRDEEKRWANLQMTLRGNPRFIICHPHGSAHYGTHIPWSTLRKVKHTDEAHRDFADFRKRLMKK